MEKDVNDYRSNTIKALDRKLPGYNIEDKESAQPFAIGCGGFYKGSIRLIYSHFVLKDR